MLLILFPKAVLAADCLRLMVGGLHPDKIREPTIIRQPWVLESLKTIRLLHVYTNCYQRSYGSALFII